MEFHIKLTIQEIVNDFEKLLRLDEELNMKLDFNECGEEDIGGFYDGVVEIAAKYIPNYMDHMPETYTRYDFALELYKMVYGNFREIFFKLV